MKRLIAFVLSAAIGIAHATTFTPIQLLNPTGSTSGQAIVSNGASSSPSWVSVLAISGGTLTGPLTVPTLNTSNAQITGGSVSGITSFASPGFASFGNQTTWLHSLISCSTDCAQTWSQSTGGGSGLLGATRTSDNTLAGSMAAQGVAGYAINNNTTQVQTGYAGYFEARKSSGAGTTQVIEADLVNQGALVTLDPYNMLTTGITPALWLSSGRPDVTSGATNASAAVGIINNNTQFDKGIVFQSNSVTVNSGEAVAFALPVNYALDWYASAGTKVARIRSDATTASLGLVFANGLACFQTLAGTCQVTFDTSGNLTAIGNVSADSTTYLLGNISGQSLPGNGTTTGANSIGWNRSNGGGETNFVNAKGGGSTGGFQWCQWDGTNCTNTGTLGSTGNFSVTGSIKPSTTAGILGTTAADSANAGSVGEFVVASTQNTSLSNGVVANATSGSLTAGDYDVWGIITTVPAGTTVTTAYQCGISTTSAAYGTVATGINNANGVSGVSVPAGTAVNVMCPPTRINVSTTTTVYAVTNVSFTTSTMQVSGAIMARRRR